MTLPCESNSYNSSTPTSSSSSLHKRPGKSSTKSVGWGDGSDAPTGRGSRALQKSKSIRNYVKFTERRFDVNTLPADLRRVYRHLEEKFGEEYGLIFVFTVRTAIELHRAWHMTLLTTKLLQQIKDRFNMRMTWNLGVVALRFRVEDGGFELHRKVPYDYDSEYQDIYMKIAVALIEGHINVHEALIFQAETRQGKHTAKSGLFLRENPGRLVLYPLEAATCAVIFFGGDWTDAGVAAVCGLASGLTEYLLSKMGGDAGILTDVIVGMVTGITGGIFYRFTNESYCLSAVFLGTLYWFFYGTAFVIGLLEIVAGELETGVTRFIAVSVKTFVLTLGACIGLQIILVGNVYDAWTGQADKCDQIDLDAQWWRIPLYILCSASVLGQYRVPLVYYWRGLIVQLCGYEVQYQMFKHFEGQHKRDFLDTAISNISGAVASVAAATILSYLVDHMGYYYSARILQRNGGKKFSMFGEIMYRIGAGYVRLTSFLRIGRSSSMDFLNMEKKLKQTAMELRDPNHARSEIVLEPKEEAALVEAIVDAESLNIWSILMPAVYQLVPGSLIAKLWFNAVFPPPLVTSRKQVEGTELYYSDVAANPAADDVFYGLFVISASLALGILFGFALVQTVSSIQTSVVGWFGCCQQKHQTEDEEEEEQDRIDRLQFRQQGIMPSAEADDDPDKDCFTTEEREVDVNDEEHNSAGHLGAAANIMDTVDEDTSKNSKDNSAEVLEAAVSNGEEKKTDPQVSVGELLA